LLLNINVANNILSISKIYFGNTWVERELKEFNNIYFIGLIDNRKLLSNYNYNNKLNYNQFNSIINDLKI
jgi:Ni,Fe-hydrogenase III component G